jgi:hypothetical protein
MVVAFMIPLILIAVVEDRVRALDALWLQIAKPSGERLELSFRIQILNRSATVTLRLNQFSRFLL